MNVLPKTAHLPSMRRMHIVWLFVKASYSWQAIIREMGAIGVDAKHIRTLMREEQSWRRATRKDKQVEYERRAQKALRLEIEGRISEHDPLYPEELALMGARAMGISTEPAGIVNYEGQLTPYGDVMGMHLPNPMATVKAAVEAGIGPDKVMETIKQLYESECVTVPAPTGFSLLTIPPTAKRLKAGDRYMTRDGELEATMDGVYLMGTFWDSSYIVPDMKARERAVKLAKEVLGITDKAQLDLIVGRLNATKVNLQIEHDEYVRKKAIEAELDLELGGKGKEVKQGGIAMTRPKQLTAEQYLAKYGPPEEKKG